MKNWDKWLVIFYLNILKIKIIYAILYLNIVKEREISFILKRAYGWCKYVNKGILHGSGVA